MANVKISGLPAASTLTGAELVPVVQSGVTSQTTLAAMPYVPSGTGAVTTTVQAKLRQTVSVKDFGAVGDGVTDDTAAIQAAIDSFPANGGTIYLPIGTYLISTLNFPNDPKTVNMIGESMNGVIIQMATAAGPVIRKVLTSGRINGAVMANFTIRANSSSDKTNLSHKAMVLSGWNNSFFKQIAYKSYTTSSGSVGKFIDLAANPYLTYQNVFEGIKCEVNYGPSQVISLNNNGTNVLNNPNVVEIRDSWFYACTGINTIINAADCTRVTIRDCEFEDCAGATGVVMGQNTLVEGCWFELLGTNISTNSAASTDGSSSVVLNNYFSGTGTNFIDTINVKPLWIGNAGGGQTITGQGVIKIDPLGASPAAPTLSVSSGSVSLVSATTPVPLDTSGRVTYQLAYTYTPAATGFYKFTVSAISGYTIETIVVGSIRNANGDPKSWGVDSGGQDFWVAFTSTDAHSVIVRATFKKTGSF
ncbi:Pectate lyase superfamily protein [uncultured Caudovirales phage]|uniref:Pectate lyase superfamily protein n=1 Tax=uncultured Caudovirales phage TaxID=2100421 RepID=A0A6J5NXF2_9CAUD|nr:Pectate lyase superfamily protein [uncultured Caudovirales phage]